jgi:hypothetical protein
VTAAAIAAPAAAAGIVGDAPAAVCADHPDQAAAQRAADTVGGIYCESLPWPCLKPGGCITSPATCR